MGVTVIAIEVTQQAIAKKKIEESENRFRRMVQQAPVALAVLRGKDYIIDIINDKMLEIWDYKAEQMITKPVFEVMPEAAAQGFKELLDGVYKTGVPFVGKEIPINLIIKGKTHNHFLNFVSEPLYNENKIISGIVCVATDVTEQAISRKKNEENEKQVRKELADTQQLQKISTRLIHEDNVNEIYQQILEVAMNLMGSDFASIQVYDPINEQLFLLGNKNFHPRSEKFWQTVNVSSGTPCGEALKTGQRIIITDIETNDITNTDAEELKSYRLSGIRSVQSTPLLSREGSLLGMVSTHWKKVHEPSPRDLNLIDVLARQAADLIESNKAERQLKESEERFRSLAQALPQLVWVTDAQGNAEFASLSWKQYSGIEPGGEKEWKAIVHPDDYNGINAAWVNSLATGNIYKFDVRLKSKNGEYRWHTVKGVPVLDKENNIVKWVGAFTDIHEQKIIEEKKDEFISIASHEMKTPLTTAKAYLQMLELSLDEHNENANLYANKASQSVNRLNELVGELLDASKIRLGKLNYNFTTFDFNDMIDNTVENIQLTSPTHSIIKTGKVYDEVTGDKDRLQQVVINLLNNAIKYSPGAEKVFITIEQQKDIIKVSVKDTGIGIAQQSLDKIFDKYHRVEEHALHFQGLGIGLFISYEIIQRHHGKLWAESEAGVGSTFNFTIPLNFTTTE